MEDRMHVLERRVAELEDQVTRLLTEGAAQRHDGTTLLAPIRIINTAGEIIAEIRSVENDCSLRLFNAQGQAVATLGVDGAHCGYLTIRDEDGVSVGYMDVEQAGARLILTDHTERGGVALFGGDNGEGHGGGVNINSVQGSVSLDLWAGAENGNVNIYNTDQGKLILALPGMSDDSTP